MWHCDKMSQDKYNKCRERTDRISALLGEYLLKGYRMLGTCCEKCGTVLLKNRNQADYCVACNEVDVIQESAKQTASDEHQQHEPQPVTTDNTSLLCSPSQQQKTCSDPLMKGTVSNTEAMNSAIGAISDKILWASNALKSSCSTEESIRLCELLKVCAETLKVLQDLQK